MKIGVSTPGRVCLFGEHQDYLGLPIIASAISKRVEINGEHRSDNFIKIDMPDIKRVEGFYLDDLEYTKSKDYYKSVIRVLNKRGFTFSKGVEAKVEGKIPINAGTSSSSALVVSWINFMALMSDQNKTLDQKEIGEIAYEAEVIEFDEAGGMMDQYSTAMGGVIYLSSVPDIKVDSLNPDLKTFVLGDSRQPKDTQGILKRVKLGVLNIVEKIKMIDDKFSLQTITLKDVNNYSSELTLSEINLLQGTIKNRDNTVEAKKLLEAEILDHKQIGEMLNEHHSILSNILGISTKKIDTMIADAIAAGAYGAKINGSGGGGCMFAYAPENPEAVAAAIEKAGGKSYIINCDEGTKEISG